uniref:Uncharacterized protein n=1 Tax=Tanacetum cinerariifolium TaxID=118510 RepID=A0A6L2NQQ7_TANCI|nr:hypothetical protein [Tanacetum cinerariifolium]
MKLYIVISLLIFFEKELYKNLRIQLPPTEHSAHVEDIVAFKTAIARIFLENFLTSSGNALCILFPTHGRKIVDIDVDAEVNLKNVYNLDTAHEETVLSMQDADVRSERIEDVVKDFEDVVATAENVEGINAATIPQISKDDVTFAQTLIEIKVAKPKAKGFTIQNPSKFRTTLPSQSSLPSQVKDKGKGLMVEPEMPLTRKDQIALDKEVARWKYQALKRKLMSVAQARKNMMIYLKNMARYKMDYFKGMSYEQIRPIFEMEYNKVQAYLNNGQEMDAEWIKAPRKRTRKDKVEKDQPAKKQKGDELK